MRGADLTGEGGVDPHVLEIPLVLEAWEPAYALATYGSADATFPMPPLPAIDQVELPSAPPNLGHDPATAALAALVEPWAESSNGNVDVASVEGTALEAVAALGVRRVAAARLGTGQAMALMAWAGASGGAYAPRQGAAAGRFGAWWAAAGVTGLVDHWPLDGDELPEASEEVAWWAWSDLFPSTGWSFHLAAEDPVDGLAWAIAASDAA